MKTNLVTGLVRQPIETTRRLKETIWKNLEELGYGG